MAAILPPEGINYHFRLDGLIGISSEQVAALCRRGKLSGAERLPSRGRWMIPASTVEDYLLQHPEPHRSISPSLRQVIRRVGWAIGALVTLVALIGIVSYVADWDLAVERWRTWAPLRRVVRPAGRDEILILVASFYHSEGVPDTEPQKQIRSAIAAAKDELSFARLRVEVHPQRLEADDRSGAENLARRYGACLIIWGEDLGRRVTINYLNLRGPTLGVTTVRIVENVCTQLANPSAYDRFIVESLSPQLVFFSLYAVGRSYMVAGDYKGAACAFERVTTSPPPDAIDPVLAEAFLMLGWLYQQPILADSAKAIQSCDQALRLQPDRVDAYNNRGVAYYYKGDLEHALQDFDQALRLQPDSTETYYARGIVYNDMGNLEHALQDFSEVLRLQSDHSCAYAFRGNVYHTKGDLKRAIQDYDQVLRLRPDEVSAYANRGSAYAEEGNLERAIQDYDQALRLQPDLAGVYNSRGFAYARKGDLERAIQDYDQALRLQPDNAVAYGNRGDAYHEKGKLERAIQDYDQVLRLQPDGAGDYIRRGNAYAEKGDRERAIQDYDQALRLQSDCADAYVNRGNAYAEEGDLERAFQDYDQALRFQPDHVGAYRNRGVAYHRTGDRERAIADWRKALSLTHDPANQATLRSWLVQLGAE
jgi:tetratricopeptide (TPR) repeat protein